MILRLISFIINIISKSNKVGVVVFNNKFKSVVINCSCIWSIGHRSDKHMLGKLFMLLSYLNVRACVLLN